MAEENNRVSDQTRIAARSAERLIAQFRITGQIGFGGMGEVYLAIDPQLQRQVALKLLPPSYADDPDTKARFLREAQTAAALNHPNIVTIYQIGEHDGQPYIAMEYVDGMSLKETLAAQRLSFDRSLTLLRQICEGLSAAHEKGIVHRDIKPANVLLGSNGLVKLLDFGLAKFQHTSGLTQAGTRLGTISYMSPEQAQGLETDHRSDIFSLGVMFYEMLSGKVPFARANEIATLFAIVHEHHPSVSSESGILPAEVTRVVDRALQKDLAQRYQSVGQLMADLWGAESSARESSARTIGAKPAPAHLPGSPSRIDLSLTQSSIRKQSLAVLPFENMGPTEHAYFAEGVTEEVTTSLAKVKQLRVISYNSSRHFRHSEMTASAISRELGVEYLLIGTIRWDKSGETSRFRLSCKLVNAADDSYLWAENYDHVLDQIFTLQSELAEKVTQALGVALGATDLESLGSRQTANLEAYDFFLRGNEFFPRSTSVEDLKRATENYEKAIELDPDFALAHAKLSWVHSTMYWFFHDRTPARVAMARQAVEKAVAINPNLPESKLALGYYYYYGCQEYEQALEQFAVALESRPNDASLLAAMGFVQRRLGRWPEALKNINRAAQLDPRSALYALEVGNTMLFLRQYDTAASYFERALWLVPDWADAYARQAQCALLRDGNPERAVEVLKKAAEHLNPAEVISEPPLLEVLVAYHGGDPLETIKHLHIDETEMEIHFLHKGILLRWAGSSEAAVASFDSARVILETKAKSQPDSARIIANLGIAYAGAGRAQEGIQASKRATELMPFAKDNVFGAIYLEALTLTYMLAGEYDLAVDQCRKLLTVPSTVSKVYLLNSPLVAPLRQQRDLQTLL